MKFDKRNIGKKTLVELYKKLLKPRLIEEKMLVALRQGKVTKWFSGIGQEAISVGATAALDDEAYILPMHRNLGVFTTRNVPLNRLFGQFQGKTSGFTKGRDRSFHFGSREHHIVGMISHLGPQMAVADGIALASKLKGENQVTVVFTGDGGTSEGDFHEALNVAAVWDLPVIFLVENNGYGLSTPTNEQFRINSFTDKGPAYGINTYQVDGNNVLDVYHLIKSVAKNLKRKPRPVLIEAVTFRMRGHEESSGTKYVPEELFKEWAKKDPIDNYEQYLLKNRYITETEIYDFTEEVRAEIDNSLQEALDESLPSVNTKIELADVYRSHHTSQYYPSSHRHEKRYIDAISEGLKLALTKYPELVMMGQDIAEYGGVFKVSEGFVEEFGKDRIRNTPICESAILGIGLGMSVMNAKSIVEMQFADFVSCGFNQIVNNLAKTHYRWGQNADVVVRMPTGAGVGAGPFHSQSNEAWFFHTPGLKIVYPSSVEDAKGLLLAAIEDPNPVLFFEHKYLYRSISEEIPVDYYTTPIGNAKVVQEGDDITVVTYGLAVHWVKEIVAEMDNVSVDIIDLRTLLPWDKEAVKASVEKTGRVLICHEDCLTGSISGEIASWIGENCFQFLDAPILREGSLDTPVPFAKPLENNFLPKDRIAKKLKMLAEY